MIDIIPNWHPIFVHFTVALISVSVGLHLISYIGARILPQKLCHELATVARWCLWIGALVTFITVGAGIYAYYTVGHDAVSHAAMTIHRNWALSTAIVIWLIALWSVYRYVKQKQSTLVFIIALLIMQGLVLTTAWLGGEIVYRYGLGVMSLPMAEEMGHAHASGAPTMEGMQMEDMHAHHAGETTS